MTRKQITEVVMNSCPVISLRIILNLSKLSPHQFQQHIYTFFILNAKFYDMNIVLTYNIISSILVFILYFLNIIHWPKNVVQYWIKVINAVNSVLFCFSNSQKSSFNSVPSMVFDDFLKIKEYILQKPFM